MTILARRDYEGGMTAVSASHGGCGQTHRYEIGPTGFPQIDCVMCEVFLRTEPNHAVLASKVPETHDEELTRVDWEKRGAADSQWIQAAALAKMLDMEIPESMRRALAGTRTSLPGLAHCPGGHAVTSSAKFCPECAAPMVPEVIRCGSGHANAPAAKFCSECAAPMGDLVQAAVVPDTPALAATAPKRKPLKDWSKADLQARCRELGVPDDGPRATLITRIRAAA